MEHDSKTGTAEKAGQKTRRAFVKSAAQVAVTAPAVTLLLSASTKAKAAEPPYSVPQAPFGDDFVPPGPSDDDGNDDTPVNFGDDFGLEF